jgi:hypothetical protein
VTTECLSGSYGSKDFFCQTSSLANLIQRQSVALMRQSRVNKCKKGRTYCVYLETTVFMRAPVTTRQGRTEDNASASCHDRI